MALGHVQLQRDEIESGDQLGHRVLHLQAGVHLEEREATLAVEQELDGAGADVPDGCRGRDRGGEHVLAQFGVDGG